MLNVSVRQIATGSTPLYFARGTMPRFLGVAIDGLICRENQEGADTTYTTIRRGSLVYDGPPEFFGGHTQNSITQFGVTGQLRYDPVVKHHDALVTNGLCYQFDSSVDVTTFDETRNFYTVNVEADSVYQVQNAQYRQNYNSGLGIWVYQSVIREDDGLIYKVLSESNQGELLSYSKSVLKITPTGHIWHDGRNTYMEINISGKTFDKYGSTVGESSELDYVPASICPQDLEEQICASPDVTNWTIANFSRIASCPDPFVQFPDYSSSLYEACENLSTIGINNIENIDFITSLKSGLAGYLPIPKKGAKVIDMIADAYLWYSYMVRPTISDAATFSNAAKFDMDYRVKHPKYTTHGSYTNYDEGYTTHATIYGTYEASNIFQAIGQKLDQLGFLPTPDRLWEIVPFSFVVDWFFPVGDILGRSNQEMRLLRNTYGVEGYVQTVKKTTVGEADPSTGWTGTMNRKYYHRTAQRKPNFSGPIPGCNASGITPSHIAQAGALIVSNH